MNKNKAWIIKTIFRHFNEGNNTFCRFVSCYLCLRVSYINFFRLCDIFKRWDNSRRLTKLCCGYSLLRVITLHPYDGPCLVLKKNWSDHLTQRISKDTAVGCLDCQLYGMYKDNKWYPKGSWKTTLFLCLLLLIQFLLHIFEK